MATKIFVNLPVRDVKRSIEFFRKLGYDCNPQFTEEKAACLVITDHIYAMLVSRDYFGTFTPKPVSEGTSTEVLVALTFDSRADVERVVNTALANGARRYSEPKDKGFMFEWGFEDLDGHIWEIVWMDPAFVQK